MHTCTHCEREGIRRKKKEERIKNRIVQLQSELKAMCTEHGHELLETSLTERIPVHVQEYQSYTDCDCDFACHHEVLQRMRDVEKMIEFKIVTKTCVRCGEAVERNKRRVR